MIPEPPLIRWKRQAEEAKIRKEKDAREKREKNVHDAWANMWTRAKKHDVLTKKLQTRWSRPYNFTETERRARKTLERATKEHLQHPKRPWKP